MPVLTLMPIIITTACHLIGLHETNIYKPPASFSLSLWRTPILSQKPPINCTPDSRSTIKSFSPLAQMLASTLNTGRASSDKTQTSCHPVTWVQRKQTVSSHSQRTHGNKQLLGGDAVSYFVPRPSLCTSVRGREDKGGYFCIYQVRDGKEGEHQTTVLGRCLFGCYCKFASRVYFHPPWIGITKQNLLLCS